MIQCGKIFNAKDVAEIDKYTIEHEPITSLELMERAAEKATARLMDILGYNPVFNIISGSGNNGGDGFVMGRLLAERGFEVTVYAVQVSDRLSPDCRESRRRYQEQGGMCVEVDSPEALVWREKGVVVDALFGVGLNRPVTGWMGEVIRKINDSGQPVVAIDMPSGLFGEDNRENDGAIVRADYTLTFQFPKLSLLFSENECYAGRLEVLDIGLHPRALAEMPSHMYYLTWQAVASRLPRWSRFAHKGTLGHALLVAGSYEMQGAALLAAKGAIRSGAGLLTVHVPRALKSNLHLGVPEALVDADRDENCFTGVADLSRYDAMGVGPGLGVTPETIKGLRELLERWKGRCVLDADALNILAGDPERLKWLPEGAILTPHPKEFERLAGKSVNDFDRLNKLLIFAANYRVYVVLKGAHTAIATPEGECYFNMTGNPGMAKGGSGDVLTGMITALLANGLPPLDAAIVGVYMHGMAGDMAAERHGMRGMTSGDIAEALGEGALWADTQRRERSPITD